MKTKFSAAEGPDPVHRRRVFARLIALWVCCWVAVAHAAPRDKAANAKVDEAINKYYLATEFNRAEAILLGTLEACEDRCSGPVKARAWMYVGIVRGSGKQNIGGAQEAFQQALALDPNVALDEALATPAVKEAFESAAATLGQSAPATGGGASRAVSVPRSADLAGEMECTPTVSQVETRRPIPVACTTDEPASRVTLRYKVFGGESWLSVPMTRKGQYWQGEIPCGDTGIAGQLRWFVRAQDRGGDTVDSYGSKGKPAVINLVNRTDEPPPAYPGQGPPVRCADVGACPEEMIGTPACPDTGQRRSRGPARGHKGWGAPCDESKECEAGLLCLQSETGKTCESAPSCDVSADCPEDAECVSGMCELAADSDGPSGPYKKNWFGLHGALDVAFLSGQRICSNENRALYSCFFADGQQYGRVPFPAYSGNVDGVGAALGTVRVLASYERALSANLGLEGRVGYAFFGGPKPEDGNPFLPVHAELRGKLWFGSNPYNRKGIRPYIFLGGGLAQVDAKLTVTVYDCGLTLEGCRPPPPNSTAEPPPGQQYLKLDAYKKMGQTFVTGGGGAMYALGPDHGPVLNLNVMYMLPDSGLVLEPSVGYQLGL